MKKLLVFLPILCIILIGCSEKANKNEDQNDDFDYKYAEFDYTLWFDNEFTKNEALKIEKIVSSKEQAIMVSNEIVENIYNYIDCEPLYIEYDEEKKLYIINYLSMEKSNELISLVIEEKSGKVRSIYTQLFDRNEEKYFFEKKYFSEVKYTKEIENELQDTKLITTKEDAVYFAKTYLKDHLYVNIDKVVSVYYNKNDGNYLIMFYPYDETVDYVGHNSFSIIISSYNLEVINIYGY